MTALGLAALATEAAAAAPGTIARSEGATTTWTAAGKPIVVLSSDAIEFRLDAVIGAAARRTPDTTTSARGEEWVTFRPAEIDQYAEDRIRAWFGAAYRRASA